MTMKMDVEMDMSMKSSFHFDPQIKLLFDFWQPRSTSQVVWTCVAVFFIGFAVGMAILTIFTSLGFMYQFFKYLGFTSGIINLFDL